MRHSAPDARDDGALCDAVRAGDTAAFGELFVRHASAARAIARRCGAADVEDAVGDAFAGILSALRRGHGPGPTPFRPYLVVTIERNVARERRGRRAEDRRVVVDPVRMEAIAPALPDPTGRVDERIVLREAGRGVPHRHRLVLHELEVTGRPSAEVARDLGLSANALRVLAWRARASLRRAYLASSPGTAAPALSDGRAP